MSYEVKILVFNSTEEILNGDNPQTSWVYDLRDRESSASARRRIVGLLRDGKVLVSWPQSAE